MVRDKLATRLSSSTPSSSAADESHPRDFFVTGDPVFARLPADVELWWPAFVVRVHQGGKIVVKFVDPTPEVLVASEGGVVHPPLPASAKRVQGLNLDKSMKGAFNKAVALLEQEQRRRADLPQGSPAFHLPQELAYEHFGEVTDDLPGWLAQQARAGLDDLKKTCSGSQRDRVKQLVKQLKAAPPKDPKGLRKLLCGGKSKSEDAVSSELGRICADAEQRYKIVETENEAALEIWRHIDEVVKSSSSTATRARTKEKAPFLALPQRLVHLLLQERDALAQCRDLGASRLPPKATVADLLGEYSKQNPLSTVFVEALRQNFDAAAAAGAVRYQVEQVEDNVSLSSGASLVLGAVHLVRFVVLLAYRIMPGKEADETTQEQAHEVACELNRLLVFLDEGAHRYGLNHLARM